MKYDVLRWADATLPSLIRHAVWNAASAWCWTHRSMQPWIPQLQCHPWWNVHSKAVFTVVWLIADDTNTVLLVPPVGTMFSWLLGWSCRCQLDDLNEWWRLKPQMWLGDTSCLYYRCPSRSVWVMRLRSLDDFSPMAAEVLMLTTCQLVIKLMQI